MSTQRAAVYNARGTGRLPAHLDIEVVEIGPGTVRARIAIRPHHLAPNGYLHAGTVVTLADTASGYGCLENLPAGAENFTTIELKSNFFGTAREGAITCIATLAHGGRTTHVWDATITDETTGKTLAVFRCTQMLLYPRASA